LLSTLEIFNKLTLRSILDQQNCTLGNTLLSLTDSKPYNKRVYCFGDVYYFNRTQSNEMFCRLNVRLTNSDVENTQNG